MLLMEYENKTLVPIHLTAQHKIIYSGHSNGKSETQLQAKKNIVAVANGCSNCFRSYIRCLEVI